MNIFLISDTHFGHAGVCKFLRADGSKLRPWTDPVEMDEILVENWNKTVGKNDKVYHLGDVAMHHKSLAIMHRLNGQKVLVKGNHDKETLNHYHRHFYDVRGSHQFDGLLLTHIPVHVESLGRWGCNVHGHTHYREVAQFNGQPDPRYFNVSVECINYTPIALEEMKKLIEERKAKYGYNSLVEETEALKNRN